MRDSTPTRRHFLAAAGMASLGTALGPGAEPASAAEPARSGPPPDRPRELKPTGSDLGSLFPEVEKLAGAHRFAFAFPGGRFRTFEEFKAAARDKVLDLLSYCPEKVDLRPEVLERIDRGDHVREKVLFSTSPHFRVPAYVLIPKDRKGPWSISTRMEACSCSARRRWSIWATTTRP
jgi:hypothetical protein